MDCLDGSDECYCQNHVQITLNNQTIGCVSQRRYCEELPQSDIYQIAQIQPQINCSSYNFSLQHIYNPIEQCMSEYFDILYQLWDDQIIHLCENNCSSFFKQDNWRHFCKLLTLGAHSFAELSCESRNSRGTHRPFMENICDGKVDCVSGAECR